MFKIIGGNAERISEYESTHRLSGSWGYVESDVPLDMEAMEQIITECRYQAEMAFAKTMAKMLPIAPGQVFLGEIKFDINLCSIPNQ